MDAYNGVLTDKNGYRLNVVVEVGRLVENKKNDIKVSIPYSEYPIDDISSPVRVETTADFPKITISDLYISSITKDVFPDVPNTALPISIAFIGSIDYDLSQMDSDNENSFIVLSENSFLSNHPLSLSLSNSFNKGFDVIFDFEIDSIPVDFCRIWGNHHTSKNSVLIKSSFAFRVDKSLFKSFVEKTDLLSTLLSLFSRQMTKVSAFYHSNIKTIKQPDYPFVFFSDDKHGLVDLSLFSEFICLGYENINKLSVKEQKVISHISVAINPANEMSIHQRFFFMFSSFEKLCTLYVKEDASDIDNANIEYICSKLEGGLSELSEVDDGFRNRIINLSRNIRNYEPPFKYKLNKVLSGYSVVRHDLWPIFNSKKHGLIDMRNKFAHGSYESIDHEIVIAATWHMKVLLERVCLSMLRLDIEKTNAKEQILNRQLFYRRDYWKPLADKRLS